MYKRCTNYETCAFCIFPATVTAKYNWAVTCDFQQCGDSDEPVQLFLSLETPNDVRSVA